MIRPMTLLVVGAMTLALAAPEVLEVGNWTSGLLLKAAWYPEQTANVVQIPYDVAPVPPAGSW